MKKGKVQTNDKNVIVLVEHEQCDSKHYSSLDFDVLCDKMSEDEINETFLKLELTIDEKKNILMKRSGFATSNVYSKENDISFGDLLLEMYPERNENSNIGVINRIAREEGLNIYNKLKELGKIV